MAGVVHFITFHKYAQLNQVRHFCFFEHSSLPKEYTIYNVFVCRFKVRTIHKLAKGFVYGA